MAALPMPDAAPRRFQTTRWTLVRATRNLDSTEARQAIASLCELYWYPVYAFIRRSGHSEDDARDLTQAFFTRVIEKDAFQEARPERGKFRTFLLSSVRHFLANQRDAARAQKRGGGQALLSLEFEAGERRYVIDPPGDETPERTYERKWALEVIGQTMKALEARYRQTNRQPLFQALQPFLTGDEPGSYVEIAEQMATTDGALRVAVHRLRQQFGLALRETIAETVERPEDVDDELRHLLEAVAS
jgi:RNA polymerase sigma-70 factor (ECF subfamily)